MSKRNKERRARRRLESRKQGELAKTQTADPRVGPQLQQIVLQHQSSISTFSGPVPPPAMLEEFRKVDPSLPTRLVAMAEVQQAHRHKMESKLIEGHVASGKFGQASALLVVIAGFALAGYVSWLGHPVPAMAFAGGELAVLVGVFLRGQIQKKAEPPTVLAPSPTGQQTAPEKH